MYESEANTVIGTIEEIPEGILARFGEVRRMVTRRTLIPWGEHCTECVWPSCYTSCDLYDARADGKCRRFVDGMVRIAHPDALNSYILKINFKRWAKLWSIANLRSWPLADADRAERQDLRTASLINTIPLHSLRRVASLKRYSLKKRRMRRRRGNPATQPTAFIVECYNPNPQQTGMTLTISREQAPVQFQKLLVMDPGFNRHVVTMTEIERLVSVTDSFSIELTPNEIRDGLTLYFGAIDFVCLVAASSADQRAVENRSLSPCKCVVFDLDNTLWDGTLVEDGPANVRLKSGTADILRELDSRGILVSIASKNNHEEALAVLRGFGIDDYFLFPQISWQPKSQSVREIGRCLNIGLGSMLFVDDSAFEREEVGSQCAGVMLLDASRYHEILQRPDCQAAVTVESRSRRQLYRQQIVREEAAEVFRGDFRAFLRTCDLRVTVRPLSSNNLDRVHELTQRTNQMNFSGNRYSRSQLEQMLDKKDLDTYVLDCQDRFGSYGTIGFCVVDCSEPRMLDLMFSCRVQGKRVEHSFVANLVRKYRQLQGGAFFVNYRRTEKNAVPGRVFADLGAEVVGQVDGLSQLVFPRGRVLADEGIVAIDDSTRLTAEAVAHDG